MIVDEFHIVGITAFPPEAHAPLVGHAYAPLAGAISSELLKAISRQAAQIVERRGCIEHPELAKADVLYVGSPSPNRLALEKSRRVLAAEGSDHCAYYRGALLVSTAARLANGLEMSGGPRRATRPQMGRRKCCAPRRVRSISMLGRDGSGHTTT